MSGGTLRVVMPGDVPITLSKFLSKKPDPAVLDPHISDGLVTYDAWEILRCCLARTLLSYNGRSTELGGAELHPDLASSFPTISSDGLTWTFKLKEGIRYGPPLDDVVIRAQDFVRGFHRVLAPAIESFPGKLYFADIEGASEYSAGQSDSISGLMAPNDHTLVIRLTEPAGDLGARLALSFAAPIPPNPTDPSARFGVAEGHDEGFGRFLVSSGPYMLEGSKRLDFRVAPSEQKPVSGLVPGESITLVRNPAWDPRSDELRPAYPDRIEIAAVGTVEEALAEIDAGRADLVWNPTTPPTVPQESFAAYQANPDRGDAFVHDYDAVRGIVMNLAAPPFDDIHVRRALNYAIDKQRLLELQGGALAVGIADHLVPDSLEDNLLVDYDSYPTPDHGGDLQKARAEMAMSGYDSDGDGRCNAEACAHVRAITRDPYGGVARSVRDDLQALGIRLEVEVLSVGDFFGAFSDPTQKVPLYVGLAWAKGYVSASSFFVEQLYSPGAIRDGSGNGSLVGATRHQLKAWGYEGVDVPPTIDDRIEACLPLVGALQFRCWTALDQYVMENVVPWVPYGTEKFVAVTSPRVSNYAFDQLFTSPALDQIALSS